jgi:hypothetical protein
MKKFDKIHLMETESIINMAKAVLPTAVRLEQLGCEKWLDNKDSFDMERFRGDASTMVSCLYSIISCAQQIHRIVSDGVESSGE